MEFELKELENKTRKGTYIKIKHKNKPIRYYKYYGEEGQIEATLKYYEDKYIKKRKKTASYQTYTKAYKEKYTGTKPKKRTKQHRQAEQYIAKQKKQGTIFSKIKKGESYAFIKDLERSGNTETKQAKTKLLKNRILDKQILNIMITDQNFDKLKNRLDYEITVKDKNGKILMKANTHGKTLNEIKTDITRTIPRGTKIEETGYQLENTGLSEKNWSTNITKTGTIHTTDLKINFRKGKW